MFVVLPIASAYEEYGHEVMRRIVAQGYDACNDNDYLTSLNRRICIYWTAPVIILGNANMVGRTVVVRIPARDFIEEYALDDFLARLREFRTHQ